MQKAQFVFLFLILGTQLTKAQCTLTFTGYYGTDWHDARNWTTWQLPTEHDNVIIPNDMYVRIGNTNATCRTITVQVGGIVEKNGIGVLTVTNATNTGVCNKKIFLSDFLFVPHTTNTFWAFSGLAGADIKCQEAADVYDLIGTYKAWLSSSTVSAAARLNHANVPYTRSDGVRVANNWTDLTDGTLSAQIIYPFGSGCVGSNCTVWTNTATNGQISNTNSNNVCQNWTSYSESFSGRYGVSTATNSSWTNAGIDNCNFDRHLYCIEQ